MIFGIGGQVLFLFLELLFYIGLLVAFIGIVWLIWNLFRKKGKLAIFSLLVIVAGAAISASPAVYTRTIMAVDLGAREKVVDGEYHITLTGWDQTNYAFLQTKHQTVVLQMANPDVDDSILDYIQGMTLLRELDLNDSRITDAGLKKLATLNNLTTLRLLLLP